MGAYGLGAGAVGFVVGAAGGYLLSSGLGEGTQKSIALGAGGTFGLMALSTGVHLANHSRGNWGLTTLAALGGALVGLGATAATGQNYVIASIPVLQIVGAVIVQKATMDRGDSADELSAGNGQGQLRAFSASIDVVPHPDGIGVVVSSRF